MILKTSLGTAVIAALILCTQVCAVTIKLGSIAPANSPWDDALRQLAAEWSAISRGTVSVRIYPGGIAGDEGDMIRKMRIGQLDAAGLSGMGLASLYSGILAVQLPLVVRTDGELDYVMDSMRPRFESELRSKGFQIAFWNTVGWAHFFSRSPVVSPDDLRKHKLFVLAGDADGIQAWKDAGFHTVALSMNDLATALQSGMVDAFTMTPLSTVAYQWFSLAKHMCGMKWAPLIGGVVVSSRAWNQVKPEYRDRMLAAARVIADTLQTKITAADKQAVDIMKKSGLTVQPVSADIEKQWKATTEAGFRKLAGKSFDAESFRLVEKHLSEYRASHGR